MPLPAIAFDVTPLQNAHKYRGIGTYVRGLANRLSTQTRIPIEFWGWVGDGPFEAPPPHRTVLLPRPPMPQYRGAWLFAQRAMKRRALTSTVRAVHITDPEALTTLKDRRLLATVYDLIPLKEGLNPRRAIAWAGYRAYLRVLPLAATLFAISGQTADDLEKLLKVPAERVVVAPPGIDLQAPGGGPEHAGRPYFLFLGGPNPNKNLSVLLEAMAICDELNVDLRIAGRWLPRQVEALHGKLDALRLRDRVHFVGFVPGAVLAASMRDALALVVPSSDEGFGLPVGEGLVAGAVVIHSRIPVLEETSAGAALTFDPRSADQLAACLRRVAGDDRVSEDLRRRGRERAKALTWDTALERTLTAYRSVLET